MPVIRISMCNKYFLPRKCAKQLVYFFFKIKPASYKRIIKRRGNQITECTLVRGTFRPIKEEKRL